MDDAIFYFARDEDFREASGYVADALVFS